MRDSHRCSCAPDVDILFDSSCVFMLVFLSVRGITLAQTTNLFYLCEKCRQAHKKFIISCQGDDSPLKGRYELRLAFGYSREVGKMFKKKNGTCVEVNMCQQHTERHTDAHTQTNHYCVCLGISELTVLQSLHSRSRPG